MLSARGEDTFSLAQHCRARPVRERRVLRSPTIVPVPIPVPGRDNSTCTRQTRAGCCRSLPSMSA